MKISENPAMQVMTGLAVALLLATHTVFSAEAESSGKDRKPAQEKNVATNQTPDDLAYDHLRDPFWPIDWFPANFGRIDTGKQAVKLDSWEEARKRIRVTGISKSQGEYFAMVEGEGLVEKGSVITIIHKGVPYRWKVDEITSKGVKLSKITTGKK